ncbi:MAG: RagB/SusD family nutrient uptake outer membrane protein [Chitinophagaceae bacterium]|nr:RagB/SusD family nutrient uptake outer membrane protein [Chitinophagaceae bacterium]
MKKRIGQFQSVTCWSYFLIIAISGCKKFVTIDPPFTSTSAETVFKNDVTATAALTGIYMQLIDITIRPDNAITAVTVDGGLSSDELVAVPEIGGGVTNEMVFYANQLTPVRGAMNEWRDTYNKIYEVNAALEGLDASTVLTPAVKQQLTGEAKFLRGFFYFYLVNLYGGVPMPLTTNYKVNNLLPRSSTDNVYTQIIKDLTDAGNLLSDSYLGGDARTPTNERVRPSKAAAQALLARVYLYHKDYVNAEVFASKVIDNKTLYGITSLDSAFLKNNMEAIWQLSPVYSGAYGQTQEGRYFVISPSTNSFFGAPTELSKELLNSFESGDQRRVKWVGYGLAKGTWRYFPNKYKNGFDNVPVLEYSMIIRLAEQYLIRAEARAMQNKISDAQQDIDVIRGRAGLSGTTANDQASLMAAIMQERRVEYFAEWGHRWFDLKRRNLADAVIGAIKMGNWQTTDQLYPIPQIEIDKNPSLKGQQNPGY